MLSTDLPSYRGASVLLKINGEEALGILGLRVTGEAVVTTLCYVNQPGDCPLIQRRLTEEEVSGLRFEAGNRLISAIEFQTKSEPAMTSLSKNMLLVSVYRMHAGLQECHFE